MPPVALAGVPVRPVGELDDLALGPSEADEERRRLGCDRIEDVLLHPLEPRRMTVAQKGETVAVGAYDELGAL